MRSPVSRLRAIFLAYTSNASAGDVLLGVGDGEP
jgi:hypothetical protein